MKWRKTVIAGMTVLLLAVAVLIALVDADPFTFCLSLDGGTEVIRPLEKSPGEYYVILPSGSRLERLKLQSLLPIRLDDRRLFDGMSCEGIKADRPYVLSAGKVRGTLTFLQSQNVAALYISTTSGDMSYVHAEKGNEESGSLRLYTSQGTLNAAGNLRAIKARGNSTFTYANKKAYSLKLSDDRDLLGMGKAKKWILLADAFDPSHLRNKIVYDFAQSAGLPFSPDSRWVDVYLNSEYAGLYLLTERNEVHPERVNVSQGGTFCLVSSESPERMEQQNLPHITLNSGTTLRIHASSMEEQALNSLWQSVENAILAEDGIDPVTGRHWRDMIDLDSWARKYLIEEIFANHDGGRLSQFFYLSEGMIFAGPVWDYDYAMGNRDIYEAPAPNMFYVNQPYERHGSLWLSKLYRNPIFHSRVTTLYKNEFSPLLKELAEEGVWRYGSTVARSAFLDQLRWDTTSPGEEIVELQAYLSGRLDFLNKVWIDGADYIEVPANYLGRWANYVLFPGETIPPLPQRENCAWYISGTDILFDEYAPVFESMEIELRETPEAFEKE